MSATKLSKACAQWRERYESSPSEAGDGAILERLMTIIRIRIILLEKSDRANLLFV